MPNTTLEIHFKAWKFRKWPRVKIFVDGDLLEEKLLDSSDASLSIPFDLIDGEHILEVEHFGKTSKDTMVKDGEIVADTNFLINKIIVNSYELPSTLIRHCEFVADWTHHIKPEGMPDVFKQSCLIGPNGVWKLAFATPVDEWIIDQRRIQNSISKNTITYESYEPSPHSYIDYRLTDEDRQLIRDIKNLIQ